LRTGGVRPLRLPARSPNLTLSRNAGCARSKRNACPNSSLFGEASLRRALSEYIDYHAERNHQGKGNRLLFPSPGALKPAGRGCVRCRERLGGFLRYYCRAA
jgi:hypothetical protein